jgi:putative ABC transport system permease protein
MLINYLKMTLKVLNRRKFFTFISLFGISVTLMILIVITAFFENVIGAQTPEEDLERMSFVSFVKVIGENSVMQTPPNYYTLQNYVKTLQTPEKVSTISLFKTVNSYVNNQKLELHRKYTDGEFWEIMKFKFIEGRPFTAKENTEGQFLAVINKETKRQYFGDVEAIGKTIEIDRVKYRVVGIVENVSPTRFVSYADVWVPITTSKDDIQNPKAGGYHIGIILAKSKRDIPKIQEEFQMKLALAEKPDDAKEVYCYAESIPENLTRQMLGGSANNKYSKVKTVAYILIFLFMLLPAVNLVNINISRIMERSSEIGIRKAFGASKTTLLGQFIFENTLLCLLGGILGLAMSAIILKIINLSTIIPYANFAININVFFYGLLLSLIFGILSGVYPAFKMSKLQAVQALKGGEI